MNTQRAVHRCECGQSCPVIALASGYEFEWRCRCGRAFMISWGHDAAPPTFQAAEADTQGSLFVQETT